MKHTTAIRRALLRWFREEARDLPWRKTDDPYKVWLAEIILQQTRVDQGLPYYKRYVDALPTVHDLAAASEDRVLKLWEGLGYYSRARNMHKAARLIVEQYAGVLPRDVEVLQLLPGIGKYTAGAIASIAFGRPVPVVDGNVKRVLARLLNLDACIDDLKTENDLWAIAATLVPPRSPGDFNQAMMELGARICTPRTPRCAECPVARYCEAHALGLEEARPVRRPKRKTPHHEMVIAAIRRNGRYLIGKRPPRGLLGGLWEFPGSAIAPGETHEQALRRACREELGFAVKVGGLAACVNHAYSHFKVTLNVYRCTLSGNVAPPTSTAAHTEFAWARPADFHRYAFPKANHKFLELL